MGPARAYVLALAAGLLAVAAGLTAFGLSLGPPLGDLTRVGGLSERAFGWRDPAPVAAEAVATQAAGLAPGLGAGGVVVIGDSFTFTDDPRVSWANALSAGLGLPVTLVPYDRLGPVIDWLADPALRAAPPAAVIVEAAERTLFRRAEGLPPGPCALPAPDARPRTLAPRPAPLATVTLTPRTGFTDWGEALSWGGLALRLRLTGGGARVAALAGPGPFSSAARDRLLIFHEDVDAHVAAAYAPLGPEAAAEAIACALARVAAAAGDAAPVWLMVAPDKRTAYAARLAGELPPKAVDVAAAAEAGAAGRLIRLQATMVAAVAAGACDLYWPNDTHWGPLGHALAAEAALAALTGAPVAGPAAGAGGGVAPGSGGDGPAPAAGAGTGSGAPGSGTGSGASSTSTGPGAPRAAARSGAAPAAGADGPGAGEGSGATDPGRAGAAGAHGQGPALAPAAGPVTARALRPSGAACASPPSAPASPASRP